MFVLQAEWRTVACDFAMLAVHVELRIVPLYACEFCAKVFLRSAVRGAVGYQASSYASSLYGRVSLYPIDPISRAQRGEARDML